MQTKLRDIERFIQGYIDAMLWAETDDNDEPWDKNYTELDLSDEARNRIQADCASFFQANAKYLEDKNLRVLKRCGLFEYAGHDFWLTRNGHGCGFWDGDWREDIGELLTTAAKQFGECYLYLGDDGEIYIG